MKSFLKRIKNCQSLPALVVYVNSVAAAKFVCISEWGQEFKHQHWTTLLPPWISICLCFGLFLVCFPILTILSTIVNRTSNCLTISQFRSARSLKTKQTCKINGWFVCNSTIIIRTALKFLRLTFVEPDQRAARADGPEHARPVVGQI